MKLSDLSIKRPVFAVVISLLLVVLGLMSFLRLTLRELPNIDPPIVSVEVTYPGASAAVVETRVTQILEDSLSGIEGINTIQSQSRNGRADVTIEFNLTRDIEAAANDVRDRISRVMDRMPDEADPPEIAKVEADADVIVWLNMRSTVMDTMELTDYADRYIVDRLSHSMAWRACSWAVASATRCASGWTATRWRRGGSPPPTSRRRCAARTSSCRPAASNRPTATSPCAWSAATASRPSSRRCRCARARTVTWCGWATSRRWNSGRRSGVPTCAATACPTS